jgi:hypothetical protein
MQFSSANKFRLELDPWEVNTERSYYEEQVITRDKKHESTDILVSDKTPPHESQAVRLYPGFDKTKMFYIFVEHDHRHLQGPCPQVH